MFLNIITPCSRPYNLLDISNSINIPKENYRWIVVFDSESLPNLTLPENCECYAIKDPMSVSGNAQRNYALSLVESGHIYFNDDDTTIYNELWENIKDLENDFIIFSQADKNGDIRLRGDVIQEFSLETLVSNIDSHNFIFSKDILEDSVFELGKYFADGIFATEIYNKSKDINVIDKVLSIYNILR
jgi:hypothetical protein